MFYGMERAETNARVQNSTPASYSEKCLDQYKINWYIQNLDIYFPSLKRIFIDKRDQDLFKQIDSAPEKKIVVVVNQWNMEGRLLTWVQKKTKKN